MNTTTMKNDIMQFFETFADFLAGLGIFWKYLVNGLIGATVWAVYRKERFLSGLRQIVIGGLVSGYFTPVIVKKASVDLEYIGFISFVVGMLGMVIIDSLYKYALANFKKWKEALTILVGSNK